MSALQARALYDFVTEVAGELCFNTNEVLLITNQNVGSGWWEARNTYGQVGLVPQSYFEVGVSKWQTQPRHTSTPPRTSPSRTTNGALGSSVPLKLAPSLPSCAPPHPSFGVKDEQTQPTAFLPSGRPVPPVKPPGLFARMSGITTGNSAEDVNVDDVDDWDDEEYDEDEDDDDFGGDECDEEEGAREGEVTEISPLHLRVAEVLGSCEQLDNSDENAKQATTPKRQLSRIAHFSKGGGDTYLFDMHCPNVPDSVTRIHIGETPEGTPCWTAHAHTYRCSIMSPKKETKFRGMKSFIAYQITPSFRSVAVSRRYKQFDWLHQRLFEKFSTIAIPPLPEKQLSGRFAEEFIQFRLRQLQLWIDRMCRHPVVAQSNVFLHFITCADDKNWKSGKRIAERDKYQGGLFFQTVIAPPKPLDARLVEQKMDSFGRFIRSFDDSIRHLYTVGESNAKRHSELFAKEFHKLGGSLGALSKAFEFDERSVAQPLTKAISATGKVANEIGNLYEMQPQHDLYYLLEGLNEYKGLLSTFPDILLVYRASTNKIQENAGMLSEAEIETVESRADVITYTVLAEMEHFQRHRVTDFQTYMQRYLHGQIAFYRQITLRLQEALHQFDSV